MVFCWMTLVFVCLALGAMVVLNASVASARYWRRRA